MPSIMSNRIYNALSRRSYWRLYKIEERYHYGDGPKFAYSFLLKPVILPPVVADFSIFIANELSNPEGSIDITSPGNRRYRCTFNEFSMMYYRNKGYFQISNVLLDDESFRNLEVRFSFKDQKIESMFIEAANFFGY